jgi:DNA/RNA-binding protein KIN17
MTIELLRTTHGTKSINANHFYQQIVSDKEHIHMNSTQWKSLSQFVAHLGKEGKCRVEDTEKGLFIAWIDNSPDTLRRREAVLKKERQEKGDEEREQRQIQDQIKRASAMAKPEEEDPETKLLQRKEGEKMKLDFGLAAKKSDSKPDSPPTNATATTKTKTPSASTTPETPETADAPVENIDSLATSAPAPVKLSMSMGSQKPKNVFAAVKKNPLAGKKGSVFAPPKKMTEQERIMKAEMEAMERKRSRPDPGFMNKRPKMN